MSHRLALAIAAIFGVLAAIGLLLVACSSSLPPQDGSGQGGGPSGAACGTPQEGCPCTGDVIAMCSVDLGKAPDGFEQCVSGQRQCQNGKWGACNTSGATPQSTSFYGVHYESPVLFGVDGGPDGGACGPCDPYCEQTGSTLDGGLAADVGPGEGGLWDASDAPNSVVTGYLNDAGISLDGAIYHQLNPGQTAIDPVNITTSLNTVDLYFLINSTTAAEQSIQNLAAEMPTVVSTLQSQIPNIAFGDGNFTNYEAWPYAPQVFGNTVYSNRVNLTTNAATIENDFNAMAGNPGFFQVTPYVVAQATTPALYLMATNETEWGWACWDYPGTSNNNPYPGGPPSAADWWYNVGYYGQSPCSRGWDPGLLAPAIYQSGTCANGGIGAPCFRPNAFHIVMLLQSAPAMNGAYGSFPYYQFKPQFFEWPALADYTVENAWNWYYSSSLGGTTSTPKLPNNVGASQANALPSVGSPLVYTGNVTGKASQYSITAATQYDPSAVEKCTVNSTNLGTGPDTYFDFTVPAGGAGYWFDTFGSAYDTVLYIINKSSGNLMACNDDAFGWAGSAPVCCDVTQTEWNQPPLNSALVGTLPAGSYRLVVDMNGSTPPATQSTGLYQLNLWPIIDDPMMSGNPRGSSHSVVSYNQTLQALAAPGLNAYVMGVEMSGVACGQTPASWENAWTNWSLQQFATATGATVNGQPLVFGVKQDGTPGPVSGSATTQCPAASNFGQVVATAVESLTNNLAQPITAVAYDMDDLVDFDGVTGINAGPTVLTPTNIDDATFVTSIVAQPTAGCTGPSGNSYASCNPGSQPNFQVSFAVPPTVTPRSNVQIFYFRIELHGVNNILLATKPVVIVVPPVQTSYQVTTVTNDFDGVDSCPTGTHVQWGTFTWNATTPGNSNIQFFATPADTAAHLSTATQLTPAFATAQASPNTQSGSFALQPYLDSNSVPGTQENFLRITTVLTPTTPGGQQTPVLNSWNLTIDCPPSE